MPSWRWVLSIALAASAASSVATVQAQEQDGGARPVSIEEIPAPAREAILREAGGGTVREVHQETWQRGEPVYEGHIVQGTRSVIIWVDGAGHVLHKH